MRYDIDELRGKRVLLVASTGGHLTQLTRLAPTLGIDPDSPWLTFDTPQSRSLLQGKQVHFVPYVAPRDLRGVWGARDREVTRLMGQVDGAISTGAGLCLAVLPEMAVVRRKPTVFIESISRVDGPSLSGRILQRLPRVGLYSQHAYSTGPWRQGPSVLSAYQVIPQAPLEVKQILVTLGTMETYRFDRLVDLVLGYLDRHPGVGVTWQVGCTSRTDLPGRVERQLSDEEFVREIGESQLVIAHSGVGVALNILDAGKIPLLLNREAARGEHVDDHQAQILRYLSSRSLALNAERALQEPDHLAAALSNSVVHASV